MTLCAVDYIEQNYRKIFGFAMNRCDKDGELSTEAISHAYIKAHEPHNLCKIYNDWWAFNRVKEYLREHWKKKRKEQDILSFADWLDGKSTLPDFENDVSTKDYLDFIIDKVFSFIKKKYPQSYTQYTHYFEIWLYKKNSGDAWKTVQQYFKKVNVNEVQSRCSEILKEFRAYYLSKKRKYGIRRSPENN